jgi:hypothetical protein
VETSQDGGASRLWLVMQLLLDRRVDRDGEVRV